MTDMNLSGAGARASTRADIGRPALPHHQELARQHAVNVLFVIYLIIILDGVVRKYILPDAQRYLLFMRDPVILYLYFHALRSGLIKGSAFLGAAATLMAVGVFVAAPQLLQANGDNLLVIAFGFRQYFFPLLLPFVIASVFDDRDLQRFFRINLVLILFQAPLMVLQVLSPDSSWINSGGAFDTEFAFGSNTFGGFVRPAGFFTASIGNNVFLPLVGAVLLSVSLTRREDWPVSFPVFIGAAGALLVAIAVSGSRAVVVALALVGIGSVVIGFLMPGSRAGGKAVVASLVLTVAAIVTSIWLFPDQTVAMQSRFGGESGDEGAWELVIRSLSSLVDFVNVMPNTPFFGFGLGMASNAGVILMANPPQGLIELADAFENDWSRHIIDIGPVAGIVYIVYRVVLTIHLGLISLRCATVQSDPRVWLIFIVAGATIFNGTISGQTTFNGMGWFLVGVVLAAPNYVRKFR